MPLGSLGASQLSDTDTGIPQSIRRLFVGPRMGGAGGPVVSAVGGRGSGVGEAVGVRGVAVSVAVAAGKVGTFIAVSGTAFPLPPRAPGPAAIEVEAAVGRRRPRGGGGGVRAPP